MGFIRKKIAVAVSGGVDSAVAALLLKNKGMDVIGVFMKNWDDIDETGSCSVQQDRDDAKYVCDRLKIEFCEVNFVKQYWFHVFNYLLQEYQLGYTPNPDIMCNRHIKFNYLIDCCIRKYNVQAVATGHYAQTSYNLFEETLPSTPIKLLQAKDKLKDQTFFLSQIPQNSLRNVVFPLGQFLKSEVKKIAAENELVRISKKKESTGICFIGKRDFQTFISEYISDHPGPMCDLSSGKTIDHHRGLHLWTIGQCCHMRGFSSKYYVVDKSPATNTIYVAPGTNHSSLFKFLIYTDQPHWISEKSPASLLGVFRCQFRFQHTKPTVPCCIISVQNGLVISLERPLKAVTPGQYAVLYKDGVCLGSARIIDTGPSLFSLNETLPSNYIEYKK